MCKVSDPQYCNVDPSFHFNADPDPAFHFNADPDPDPAPHRGDANLPTTGPQTLQASILSVHAPPIWASKLLNFVFNADPDTAFNSNADPDPASIHNADPC